jgi:hypothetical protein
MQKGKNQPIPAGMAMTDAMNNIELFQILLSAGLDLQTLKSMMEHRKQISVQMAENNKKLVKIKN